MFRRKKSQHGSMAFIVVVVALSAALIGLIAASSAMNKKSEGAVESMTLSGPTHNTTVCNWQCIAKEAIRFESINRDKRVESIGIKDGSGYRFVIKRRKN